MLNKIAIRVLFLLICSCMPRETINRDTLQELMEEKWLSKTMLQDIIEMKDIKQVEAIISGDLFLVDTEVISKVTKKLESIEDLLLKGECGCVKSELQSFLLKEVTLENYPIAFDFMDSTTDEKKGTLRVSSTGERAYKVLLEYRSSEHVQITIQVSHQPELSVSVDIKRGLTSWHFKMSKDKLDCEKKRSGSMTSIIHCEKQLDDQYSLTGTGMGLVTLNKQVLRNRLRRFVRS